MVSPILPNPKPLDKPNAVGGATSLLYLLFMLRQELCLYSRCSALRRESSQRTPTDMIWHGGRILLRKTCAEFKVTPYFPLRIETERLSNNREVISIFVPNFGEMLTNGSDS